MLKLSRDIAIRSTTMFWVDEQIESKYEDIYEKEMPKYDSLLSIRTKEDLQEFIKKETEPIKLLTTCLGISIEKFKRIITLLRVRKGYTISSEWSNEKVKKELCDSSILMDEFCNLFFNQEEYETLIPRSILRDFSLDRERLIHICSKEMLLKMIKTSYTTAYNSECANEYQEAIIERIKTYTNKYCLLFGKITNEAIYKPESLLTISNGEKHAIVTINYTLTTSNNQSIYSNKIQKIRSATAGNSHYILINILDGAGWVARNSDFIKVYTDCNHFLNLANIDKIETIITEYFSIQ